MYEIASRDGTELKAYKKNTRKKSQRNGDCVRISILYCRICIFVTGFLLESRNAHDHDHRDDFNDHSMFYWIVFMRIFLQCWILNPSNHHLFSMELPGSFIYLLFFFHILLTEYIYLKARIF